MFSLRLQPRAELDEPRESKDDSRLPDSQQDSGSFPLEQLLLPAWPRHLVSRQALGLLELFLPLLDSQAELYWAYSHSLLELPLVGLQRALVPPQVLMQGQLQAWACSLAHSQDQLDLLERPREPA